MTALALQVLLLVIINLRVILLLWYSDGDCPDRGLLWAVLMVAPPSREHGVCLHSSASSVSSASFSFRAWVFYVRVKFVPRYFILFHAIANGIAFLILFPPKSVIGV